MTNKILVFVVAGALALTGCKKGSISGKAMDPFTGKPVANATVWLKGTPFQTKSGEDGAFQFLELKIGDYDLSAGKNKYSSTTEKVSLTETALDVSRDVFIFTDVKPGLYAPGSDSSEKILNQWLNWEVACKSPDLFGYRTKFTDTKKNVLELPAPKKTAASFTLLFYNAATSVASIEANVYPMQESQVSTHAGCAEAFGKDAKTGFFPKVDAGVKVDVKTKSENLFELTGTFPAGKSALVLSQDNKILKSYYFEAN